MVTKMAGALVVILIMEPRFAYILMPGGILLVLLTYIFRKQLKKLHKQMQEKDGLVRIFLQEHLGSLMIVKAFGKEADSLTEAESHMNEHKKARMRKNLTGYLPKYFAMLASAERLMEIEAYEKDEVKYIPDNSTFGLSHVDFTYLPPVITEGDTIMPIVLKDYSLMIRKGEFVAFTGPSGCGKSTVLKLMMGLYTVDAGEVYGCDRSMFAYVPQGNQLMSGSIRDIITFSDKNRTGDEAGIHTALQIACADGFIAELEHGIDTLLGERGLGLSEGQMQRLAIARAIYSDRPVLLLDEATSALDAGT